MEPCHQCGCARFQPNMYRPALCAAAGCFHTIAEHATAWQRDGAFFVHSTTGARLAVRPSEADAALRGAGDGKAGLWGVAPGDAAASDGHANAPTGVGALQPARVALWEAFSQQRTAAPEGVPASPVADLPGAAQPSGAHISGGHDEEEDEEEEDGDSRAAARLPALPPPAASSRQLDLFPDVPSAVPATALVNMQFDLAALAAATVLDATAAMGLARPAAQPILSPVPTTQPPPAQHSAPPAASAPPNGAAPSPGLAPPPLFAMPSPPPPLDVAPAAGAAPAQSSAAAAVVVSSAAPIATPAPSAAPAATAPEPVPTASEPAPPTSSGAAPASLPPDLLAAHLAPVYGDPFLVALSELDPSLGGALQRLQQHAAAAAAAAPSSSPARAGSAVGGGVAVFAVRQPFEEDVALPRFLILTPFTLTAVAAHPTRPGCGVLKWERSLLSLRRLTTQPVVMLEAATAGGAAARHKAAATGGGVFRGLLSRLRPHPKPGAADAGAAASPGAAPHPAPHRVDIGLLASFAPETDDSITFLRTFRAGRRPVHREGWLTKRKRSSWREHAPLGPLAWKRRYFVLEPTRLLYYAAPPSQPGDGDEHGDGGGEDSRLLKGIVPLSGWVEVSRTGAEAAASPSGGGGGGAGELHDATTRAHAFLLRTGKTSHVFSASSDAEADEWVAAIAINAQHLGAAQDEPQCVLLPSAGDAEALADALARRRRFLVDSMSAAGRAALGDAERLTLDIVTHAPPPPPATASPTTTAASARSGGGGSASLDLRAMLELEEQQVHAGYGGGGGHEPADDDMIDGMRFGDALTVVAAAGGPTNEVLGQLPPALALAVRRRLGGSDPDPAQRGSTAAAAGAPPVAAAAAADGWFYLDDANGPRGPFPAGRMREWLFARYFGPSTMVRFAGRVEDLHPGCGGDEAGTPVAFLPLSVLFADPAHAFAAGDEGGAWVNAYRATMVYQGLIATASEFGIAPDKVASAVRAMKDGDLPPDLGLLLDLCGVTVLPS